MKVMIFELFQFIGVMSMMGVQHMIFPFSYQFLSLLRCLHEIRYCYNLGLKEEQQLKLIKEIVQKSMDRSQSKAAEGKGPLDYQENVDLARSIVSTQGYSEHLLFKGGIIIIIFLLLTME